MIKVFSNSDYEKLEMEVNRFMEEVKQDCPVQVHYQYGKWTAFVFYKKYWTRKEEDYMGEVIGKGWKNKDGTINISLFNGKDRIDNVDLTKLSRRGEQFLLDYNNKELKIVAKKEVYKKGYLNEPDFIVYE